MKPRCIGIATSQTGAALRDMVRIARRRNPHVEIILAPCAVQGADAAGEIARAIRLLNLDGRADVLLVGRGGGSIEDLWAFNEEIVARAISASDIPVISCVGHETDFTIADFVADVRAATPSMAAEIAVPVISQLRRELHMGMQRISAGLRQNFALKRSELRRISGMPALQNPSEILIADRRENLLALAERCASAQETRLNDLRRRLERTGAKLEALNPDGVLERGYACVSGGGRILSSAAELQAGMQIDLRFRDGAASAQVLHTE